MHIHRFIVASHSLHYIIITKHGYRTGAVASLQASQLERAQEGAQNHPQPAHHQIHQKYQNHRHSLRPQLQLYLPPNPDCSIDAAPSNQKAPKYCDITGYEVELDLCRPNTKTASADSTSTTKLSATTSRCSANPSANSSSFCAARLPSTKSSDSS